MEVCRGRKREGNECNFSYQKRLKIPSDDRDSESNSVESTNISSPRDSGFPENGAVSSLSSDDAPAMRSEGCTNEEPVLTNRVRILEEKVDWIGRELQLIREMLQFITKVMPAGSSNQLIVPSVDSRQKTVIRNGKRPSIGSKAEKQRRYLMHSKTSIQNCANVCPSTGSSDEKTLNYESENREIASDSVSKSCSDEYDSDAFADGIRSLSGGSAATGADSNQVSREESPEIKFHQSALISGLDVIYLWEHGTDEMLPIKLWNESQLESGGEVIKTWQKIIQIFKVGCGGSLKTFVSRFTNKDGKLMNVQEIIASYQEDHLFTAIAPATNGHSDRSSSSSENSGDLSIKPGTSVEKQDNRRHMLCQIKLQPTYILPRKINGQKVSAIDVIRIWEEGFGSIPPVKLWTPNQKLKQQSKISRWKKVVDIFKTDCNSNMALFQMRYTNDCGILMPIAAIISKYEQSQSSNDPLKQPTMSNISTSVMNVESDVAATSSTTSEQPFGRNSSVGGYDARSAFNRLQELGREWDMEEAQSANGRRAFTIRQVEDWQRNNIQSNEEENMADRRQHRLLSMPRGFNKDRSNGITRCMPPRHHRSVPDLQERTFKSLAVSNEENMEATLINNACANGLIKGNSALTTGSLQNFNNGEVNMDSQATEASPNHLTTASQQPDQKGEASSTTSDSGENSDSYSGKDIDVTGSECSVSTVPSKTYSPVQSQASKFHESTHLMKTDETNTLKQSKLANTQKPNGGFNEQNPARITDEKYTILPDSDDPFEVLNLWEHGNDKCPPIRFLAMNDDVIMHPRLVAWRKFMDIFRYHCSSEKQVLIEKYSDDKGRPLKISEILQRFDTNYSQSQFESNFKAGANSSTPYQNNFFQTQGDVKKPLANNADLYILPRKINGRKVSARDVIHIWHHGLKNVPPVGSWLPHQKVRQQSKISRWKKIVEIFEVDCNGNMQLFERKYSSKNLDLLPIAAIIAKYESERNALEGETGINIKVDQMTESY